MKISHIVAISICGIAWAIYGILVQTTLCDLTADKGAVFFVLPSFQRIILTLIIAEVFAYSLWLGVSFLRKKSSNINIREALGKGLVSLYPSLCLFLLLGLFVPYLSVLYKPSKFLLDLGPIFPFIILVLIFPKQPKPEFNVERLFRFADSTSERKLGAILFMFVLAVYVFFTLRLVPPNAPKDDRYYLLTGDEPQYLLVVHSLVFDKDFNIYNNVVEGHSKIYWNRTASGFSGGVGLFGKYARGRAVTSTPEYWEGKRYSIFRLGLPLLLSPFYYLGYLWDHQIRLVTLLFLNLLTALLVWNVFHLTYYFVASKSSPTQDSLLSGKNFPYGGDKPSAATMVEGSTQRMNLVKEKTIAMISTLFFALSMPLLLYSCRIYTEVAAALFVVYAFRKIVMQKTDIWDLFSIGLGIACLPWLHDKYIGFSALLLVMFLFRCRRNLRIPPLILFGAPILVSACFLMRYYYLLFGVFYPVNMHPGFSWGSFTNASLGLILDQNHGLLPYSAFYFFAFPGVVFMWRKKRKDGFWLILFILYFYIMIASFKEWWGGACPPGRYLVPILGFFIPFVARGIYCLVKSRWVYHTLGCLSIGLGFYSMWFQGRLYKHLHPFIPYASWINLRGLFPKMTSPQSNDYRLLVGWFFVLVLWAIMIVLGNAKGNKRFGYQS